MQINGSFTCDGPQPLGHSEAELQSGLQDLAVHDHRENSDSNDDLARPQKRRRLNSGSMRNMHSNTYDDLARSLYSILGSEYATDLAGLHLALMWVVDTVSR